MQKEIKKGIKVLAGDKLTPEIHLIQPGFTYNTCKTFTKLKKEYINWKKNHAHRENSRYIYQNDLDETCFQHEMTYGDFKDLPRRTASDKALHNKAFNIAKNTKIVDNNVGLLP